MRSPKILLYLCLLLAVLILSGCIYVNQEIHIDPNGRTGTFSLEIALSESLISMSDVDLGPLAQFQDLVKILGANPFVDSFETNTYSEGGYSHFAISADLSDIESFLATMDEFSAAGLTINFADLDDGSIKFTQLINPTSAKDSLGIKEFALGLISSAFEGQYWNMKLYIPNTTETNGTWNDEGKYVEWNIPMLDIFSSTEPILLSAIYLPKPPINPVVWIILIALVIAVVGVIIYFVLRSRKASLNSVDSDMSNQYSVEQPKY